MYVFIKRFIFFLIFVFSLKIINRERRFFMQQGDNLHIEDQRVIPFTMVDNDVLDSMSFSNPNDKLLYTIICRFSHMREVTPSIGTLMLMTGIKSPNTLKAALKRLEELELMRVINRGKYENGEHKTHRYSILKVPDHIRENSVFKDDKREEKQKELLAARKKKAAAKKKKDPAKKNPPSNFDGPQNEGNNPPSNFDVPPSNFDGPPSNFDGNELRLYKKDFTKKNLKSIYQTEKQKTQIDRLKGYDLKNLEKEFEESGLDPKQFHIVLNNVFANGWDKNFKGYLRTSIKNFKNPQAITPAAGPGVLAPDWIKNKDPRELDPETENKNAEWLEELLSGRSPELTQI
jgi:hypothetical protein